MDIVAFFFELLTLFSCILYIKHPTRKEWIIVSGACAAIALLIHPISLIIFFVIAIFLLLFQGNTREKVIDLTVFTLPILIYFILLVWSIYPHELLYYSNESSADHQTHLVSYLLSVIKNELSWKIYTSVITIVYGAFVFITAKKEKCDVHAYHGYHRFAHTLLTHIPNHSSVLLATIPDPYFDLQQNPTLTLYEFPQNLTREQYDKLLLNVNIILFDFTFDDYLSSYAQKNNSTAFEIKQPGGYQTSLIQLTPSNRRK